MKECMLIQISEFSLIKSKAVVSSRLRGFVAGSGTGKSSGRFQFPHFRKNRDNMRPILRVGEMRPIFRL